MVCAVPVVCLCFFFWIIVADAIDDNVDTGDAFAGHFLHLLGDALLDLVADGGQFDAEAEDDADLDPVVADFVFFDAHAPFIALLGKNFGDAIDKAAADCGDADHFQRGQADDAGNHAVVDPNIAQRVGFFGNGGDGGFFGMI